ALIRQCPTWGASRRSACWASGRPRNGCRPLSTPPMRLPRPPASTRPVMSSRRRASATDVAHLDAPARAGRSGGSRQAGAQLRVLVAALLPQRGKGGGQFGVAGAIAQQAAQVPALRGKQAQIELAFGRQPRAVAVAAEGFGDA